MHMISGVCWQERGQTDVKVHTARMTVRGKRDMDTEKTEYMGSRMTKEVMVYHKIKQSILHNEFEPGTVMVERKLTEIYQVSRSPVRYALRQLAKEGLLVDEPGRGIIVPIYTLEDILEVYDLLDVLQVYALQISLKNYDMVADAALGQILDQMKRSMEKGDLIERMEWDIKFHNFMIRYVNNKRLDMMFELLVNQKRRFDITSYEDLEHGRQTTQQHEEIYEAVKKRDLDEVIAAEKRHSQYIKQYYIDKLVTGRYNV